MATSGTTEAQRGVPARSATVIDRMPNTALELKPYTRPGCDSIDDYAVTDALAYFVTKLPVRADEVLEDSGGRRSIPENAYWTITSPNEKIILLPPLGWREVRAYVDGHYGFDDRSRFPQFYTSKAEYIMCIPRYCDKLHLLWHFLLKLDCCPIPGIVNTEILIVKPAVLERVRPFKDRYAKKVLELLETRQASFPALLVTHMCQCFERLGMGMTFRSIVQTWAEFQRTCLDIHGYLNYVKIFHPRSLTLPIRRHPVDHSIMGAFTHDISDAQKLVQMGVPVWLIRPSCDLLPNMTVHVDVNVKKMLRNVHPRDPTIITKDFFITSGSTETPFPFPTLYRGMPGTELQEALQRIGCRVSGREQASAVGATPITEGSGDGYHHVRSVYLMPYIVYQLPSGTGDVPRSTRPSVPAAGSELFNPVFDIAWVHSWSGAITALPENTVAAKEYLRGSVFPPPHIFLWTERRKLLVAAWLAIRAPHVHNILDSLKESPSSPKTQQWRHFLDGLRSRFPPPAPASTSSNSPSGEPAAKRPRQIEGTASSGTEKGTMAKGKKGPGEKERKAKGKKGPGKNVTKGSRADRGREDHERFAALPLRQEKVGRIAWLDKEFAVNSLDDVEREITQEVVEEVVWELHELNFRLELMVVDRELRPEEWRMSPGSEGSPHEKAAAQMQREVFLRRVFPVVDGVHSGFFVGAMPNVDGGLAAIDWRERARHVLALREVVMSWPNCPSSIVDASLEMEQDVMKELERLVVAQYCRTFHSLFGRAPTPPVCLPPISLSRPSPAPFYTTVTSNAS